MTVNPKDLVVPLSLFEALVSEQALKPLSLVRHYLLLSNYTDEKVLPSVSGPSYGMFIDTGVLASLSHKQTLVTELEGFLRDFRTKYLEDLEKLTGGPL